MRFGWREAILLVAGFACWRTLQRSFFRPSLGAAVSPLGRDRPQPSASNASAPLHGIRAEFAERPEAAVLVALNKKVYRFVDERNYSCPAMRGAPCMFTTLPTKFGRADAIIDVLKDPRKVRPLGWRSVRGQLRGVIISEQDRAKRHSTVFKHNAYDFEIGYNKEDATIWRPFMCNELSRKTNVTIADTLLRGPPPAADPQRKTGMLAAFVSNCVGWRLEYLRELRKHVALDSYGKCLHNNDTCAKGGKHKCERVDLAGSYRFIFAFENVEESHYVTEKVASISSGGGRRGEGVGVVVVGVALRLSE